MSSVKDDSLFDMSGMEKWLKNLYLDPLTSYLDETIFRIDISETEQEYILEALLSEFPCKNVSVFVKDGQVQIEAYGTEPTQKEKKTRIIDFPFLIKDKDVSAHFSMGILEVFISKIKKGSGKNRYIPVL